MRISVLEFLHVYREVIPTRIQKRFLQDDTNWINKKYPWTWCDRLAGFWEQETQKIHGERRERERLACESFREVSDALRHEVTR